jgi:hypothetical protein
MRSVALKARKSSQHPLSLRLTPIACIPESFGHERSRIMLDARALRQGVIALLL